VGSIRSRQRVAGIVSALAAVLVVSACTSGGAQGPSGSGGSGAGNGAQTSSAPTTPAADPAVITTTPAADAQNVNPIAPVTVTAASGRLTAVTLVNAEGAAVAGQLSPDALTWTAGAVLGYGKTYTVTATAVNVDSEPTTVTSAFTTLQPNNVTMPYFRTTGGGAMEDGGTYGVGMVVSVHFDEVITDPAAAEKTLAVTTTPAVAGSWYWLDDQNVHWRPENYYAPGTTVTVAAKVYGVDVGGGLYGQADKSISFRIGESHVSIADDTTKQVQVFQNGTLVRTMPTSMGMGGSKVINGKTLTFWTQSGTMTVLDQANPVLMDSETYGLPHAAGGYKEEVFWSTRITTDGVYLHAAPWSIWAQGNTNTSHGCLNLSPANAEWFYKFSQVGDVVQVKNTGGSPLQVWQNGDWGLPWADWLAGSALR
jgi:lipoprotein-anchoring transpeptidase ErfK/SrfK